MRRFELTADAAVLPTAARMLAAIGLAACLTLAAPTLARADDDGPKPAPRTFVRIGDASVVLIATQDKLFAFVDRIEDNSPVEDAQVEIETSEGASITMHRAPITMNKATAGMFVGSLERKGHMQDAFMVTLNSSAGSGQEPTEIIYDDVRPTVGILPISPVGSKIAVALVSAGIGAVASLMIMLWLRNGRKRPAAGSVGSAQTV